MRHLERAIGEAVEGSFLARVPAPVTARLMRSARLAEVSAGRVIIDEADPHRCGLMVTGLARAYLTRASGRQVTVRRVTTGAAIGVAAMVGRRNPITVQAITDCSFLRLDAERLVALGRAEPALGWAIAEELSRRLDDSYVELGSADASARQRLARLLLDLSVEGQPLEVRLSQEALADAAHVSRETVGIELRRLRDDGLIRLARGQVTLLDALQLNAIAFEPSPRRGAPSPARTES